MTNAQLNNAVKKFAAELRNGTITDPFSVETKKRFAAICAADNSYKAFTADSLRKLIAINRVYHYVPFKDFGPSDY